MASLHAKAKGSKKVEDLADVEDPFVYYIYKENSVCIARGTEGDPP